MIGNYKSLYGLLALFIYLPVHLFAESGSSTTTEGFSEQVVEAYTQFESGDLDQALKGFNEVLQRDENNLSASLGRAMIYVEQQRHEDAFKSYDRITETYPGNAFAWNGRGLAAFNLENFDEALSSFKKATADRPINGHFYESLAWTYLCRGDFPEAATTAKQATLMYNQNGESPAYPLLIAYFSYLETDNKDDANRTLKYALKNKPGGNTWPSPVFDYLIGELSAADLISFVTDLAQETEARTYIGLHLRSQNMDQLAKPHLEWVAEKGDKRVFEYTLARAIRERNSLALLTP